VRSPAAQRELFENQISAIERKYAESEDLLRAQEEPPESTGMGKAALMRRLGYRQMMANRFRYACREELA